MISIFLFQIYCFIINRNALSKVSLRGVKRRSNLVFPGRDCYALPLRRDRSQWQCKIIYCVCIRWKSSPPANDLYLSLSRSSSSWGGMCPYFFYGSFFNSKDALHLEDKTQKDNKAKSYNEYPWNSVNPLQTRRSKLIPQWTNGAAHDDPP